MTANPKTPRLMDNDTRESENFPVLKMNTAFSPVRAESLPKTATVESYDRDDFTNLTTWVFSSARVLGNSLRLKTTKI